MTWVDLAVFGFLAISGLLAFARGFVREILGIGAWIGAVTLAIIAMPMVHDYVQTWVSKSEWVNPVSFVVVFLGSLIVLTIVASLIGRMVSRSAVGARASPRWYRPQQSPYAAGSPHGQASGPSSFTPLTVRQGPLPGCGRRGPGSRRAAGWPRPP